MNTQTVKIAGVAMSHRAAQVVEATGTDVAADLKAAKEATGMFRPDVLLHACLLGVEDEDTEAAWKDYVEAVAFALNG